MPQWGRMGIHATDAAVGADRAHLELFLFAGERALDRGARFFPRLRSDNHAEVLTEKDRACQAAIEFRALIHPAEAMLDIKRIDFVGSKIDQTREKRTLLTCFFLDVSQVRYVAGNDDAARCRLLLLIFGLGNHAHQQRSTRFVFGGDLDFDSGAISHGAINHAANPCQSPEHVATASPSRYRW